MNISWIKKDEDNLFATLYPNYILFNKSAASLLKSAYRVRFGFNEENDLVMQLLTKEEAVRGDIDESTLFNVDEKLSYSRVSCASLLRTIASKEGLTLSKDSPLRYRCVFVEEEHLLLIKIKEGQK